MKAKLLLLIVFVTLAATQLSFAQIPTYTLQATNFERKSIDVQNDAIEFDIRMRQTNAPNRFEYAGGYYIIEFNKAVINGTMIMTSLGSDLRDSLQLRNPTVETNTTPGQLRWASNAFPGAGRGYVFPPVDTSVLIVKVRLKCTDSMNPEIPLSLAWRNAPPIPNTYTRIFAYVGTTNTNISTPQTHLIDSSGLVNIRMNMSVLFEGRYYPLFNQLSSRDTVTAYLRDAVFPYSMRDSAKAVIDSLTFSGIFIFPNAPTGRYYIVVKHYQCIETWSKAGGDSLTANGTWHNYDFTTSASQAYGNNLKLKGGKYCMFSGDVFQDGFIDGSDLIVIDNDAYSFSSGRFLPSDLNGDGFTDAQDMLIADNNRSREVISP
jgi:hypothetical protein